MTEQKPDTCAPPTLYDPVKLLACRVKSHNLDAYLCHQAPKLKGEFTTETSTIIPTLSASKLSPPTNPATFFSNVRKNVGF